MVTGQLGCDPRARVACRSEYQRAFVARWLVFPLVGSLLVACGRTTKDQEGRGPDAAFGGSSGGPGGSAGNGALVGSSGGVIENLPMPCGVPASSQIPRLTNEQYDRTLRDLLGITALTAFDGQPPSALLAQDYPGGQMTAPQWAAYMKVAQAIAVQVMADPALRGRFLACTPTGDGTACLRETIVRFGRRAFRRPLSDAERARFEKLVAQREQITTTGTAAEVAEVLLQTFLVSPSFLQRAEISETPNAQADTPDERARFILSSAEVASRLSYTFWGTMPDEALSQAADENALLTREQLQEQATRMLRDEKARELVAAFHRFYLRLDPSRVQAAAKKDPTLFPGVDDAVIDAARDETERFFDAIVFGQNGSFADLLTSSLGFVNAKTAPFYGLDPAKFGAELQQVDLDPARRPGFLTRLAFLSTYAHRERTAPALRGAFIMQEIVGLNIGAPPPGAESTPLPQGSQFHSNRERVAAQTSGAGCAGCHDAIINPPGFALEAYDAVGAWQTTEAGSGAAIDTAASVYLEGKSVPISDPSELMNRLSRANEAQRTYARRWVSYAYERNTNPSDECVAKALADSAPTLRNLFIELTQQDSFRKRVRGTP